MSLKRLMTSGGAESRRDERKGPMQFLTAINPARAPAQHACMTARHGVAIETTTEGRQREDAMAIERATRKCAGRVVTWCAGTVIDGVLLTMALAVAALLGACAQAPSTAPAAPARAPNAQASTAPGSLRAGWQVFQEKCAACHGPAANGTNLAPDLRPAMRGMGQRRFAAIVLQRYDWGMPAGRASIDGNARRGLTDEDLRSEDIAPVMPAWADEPRVRGHIADLYAWLTARAQGAEGAGEPAR